MLSRSPVAALISTDGGVIQQDFEDGDRLLGILEFGTGQLGEGDSQAAGDGLGVELALALRSQGANSLQDANLFVAEVSDNGIAGADVAVKAVEGGLGGGHRVLLCRVSGVKWMVDRDITAGRGNS